MRRCKQLVICSVIIIFFLIFSILVYPEYEQHTSYVQDHSSRSLVSIPHMISVEYFMIPRDTECLLFYTVPLIRQRFYNVYISLALLHRRCWIYMKRLKNDFRQILKNFLIPYFHGSRNKHINPLFAY